LVALTVLVLGAPLLLGACSSDKKVDTASESSTTSSSTAVNSGPTVDVTEFAFTPSAEVVSANETITWRNDGDSKHTITPEPLADGTMPFTSTQIEPGETFVQSFNTPGTYAYFCSIHPDRMSGTVTVN
jgi:plastocyanin